MAETWTINLAGIPVADDHGFDKPCFVCGEGVSDDGLCNLCSGLILFDGEIDRLGKFDEALEARGLPKVDSAKWNAFYVHDEI